MAGNNEEYVNQIIDPKAFDQIRIAVKEMALLDQEFIDTAKSIDIMNTALAKSASFKELNNSAAKMAIEQEKLNQAVIRTELLNQKKAAAEAKGAAEFEKKVQREIAAIEKKAAKSVQMSEKERLAQIKLEMDTRKSFDSYEKGVKKKEAADKKNADQIAKNSRAYVVLSNTLEDQRKKAQDLAIIYGETSPKFLDAAKGVIELDTRLKAIDATLGKSQRNVGNYASGFNAMQSTFNQLTRELPALAVNAQTFFLAISNNLPQFFDAIKQSTDVLKEAKAAAVADAEAKGISAAATALAGGASEEAASQVGDFAKEQALAAAEGLKGPGIFKQLASSLFSVGTALSLGVTLLTLYGAEIVSFIGELFKGKEAVDKAKLSMEALNSAIQGTEFSEAIKNLSELRINVDLAKQGFLDKEKVLKQYNESIGQTTGEVKTLDQAEDAMVKNGPAYIRMTLLKAAAQIALEEAAKKSYEAELARNKSAVETADNMDKFLGAFTAKGGNPYLGPTNQEAAYNKEVKKLGQQRKNDAILTADLAAQTQIQIAEKFQRDAAEIAKKNKFDFFGGDFEDKPEKKAGNTDEQDRVIQMVEFERDAQKQIAENEKASFDDRLDAARNYNSASLRLAELTAERELSQDDLTAARKLLIKDKQNNDLVVADQEFAKLSEKIFLDQLTKEEKERAISYQNQLNKIREDESFKQGLAEQAYANGTISEKQYNDLTLSIQREFTQKYINKEIELAEELLRISTLTAEQRAEAEKNLSEIKTKASKESRKNLIDDNKAIIKSEEDAANERKRLEKQVLEEKREIASAQKELAGELLNFTSALIGASFTNQLNAIQEQIDLNAKRKAESIEFINDSVATEEEKADKISIINARAAAQEQLLDQQQRDIKTKQARSERAAAISGIIMNIALANTKTLAQTGFLGIPLLGIIAAIGAAQIATILATPIPKFEKGGVNKRDGLIITGEKGTELRINPDGTKELTPDHANISYAKAGTKIIPHHELVRMTTKPEKMVSVQGTQIDLSPLIAGNEKLYKAIKANQPKSIPPVLSKQGLYESNQQSIRLMEWQRRNLS